MEKNIKPMRINEVDNIFKIKAIYFIYLQANTIKSCCCYFLSLPLTFDMGKQFDEKLHAY
jgi:hypothetical protein